MEGGGSDAGVVAPTQGEVIAAWKAVGRVYIAVRVAGDGPTGEDVEYVGSASEEDLARVSPQEQRSALLGVVKAERDRQRALAAVETAGLVGPATF
jgi:hypothetical protein